MRNIIRPFRLVSLATSAFAFLLLTSCDSKESGLNPASPASGNQNARAGADKVVTHYGPAVPLGGGVARTFVSATKAGQLSEVGIAISEKVLIALLKDKGEMYMKVLQFPKQFNIAPFQHVLMDWNPDGHEPEFLYGVPHFDFHFYMIPSQDREAIPGLPGDMMDPNPPAPQYLPAGYIQTPGRVPAMGTHWVDPTSPEFQQPGGFTRTMIYGSYNSEVIFIEPMITLDYLLNGAKGNFDIKQPAAFPQTGEYPTQYSIRYDSQSKDYIISLMNFAHHTGGVN
ncbi:DUF5602 domain-containing protein [Nibrella saemangeumensis]|uniref:DUF5602 domain-containing protein n=1 Tax=Nibrella saemangeumensis TaxID=1084526 RepID=A0ABP8M9L2_9BACT